MQKKRIIFKIENDELVKLVKVGDKIGEPTSTPHTAVFRDYPEGYQVNIGYVTETKEPSFMIESDIIDVELISKEEIYNIWCSTMSWMLYNYIIAHPNSVEYRFVMDIQFRLIVEIMENYNLPESDYLFFKEICKRKQSKNFHKFRDRYFRKVVNMYVHNYNKLMSDIFKPRPDNTNLTIYQAIEKCREGCFVTHKNFDSEQSMHMYNCGLYYEDGANVSCERFDITQEEWAQDGWRVKFSPYRVNINRLDDMHKINKGYMLSDGTYEECIIDVE